VEYPNRGQQKLFSDSLALAFEGKAKWLDELVRKAGYVHPEDGLSQADLVTNIPRMSRQLLLSWESKGLKAVKHGKNKYYPVIALIAWIYERFVKSGHPPEEGDDTLHKHKVIDLKYRARIRKLSYKRLAATMIERVEAERNMVRMALEFRAGLLPLAQTVAPQLEHLEAPAISAELERRFEWLLDQLSKDRIPVPPGSEEEITAAIKKALGKCK